MSEPESPENNPNDSASQVEDQLGLIRELEQKLKLLRRGLFVGVLAVMALGILSIWNTTKNNINRQSTFKNNTRCFLINNSSNIRFN